MTESARIVAVATAKFGLRMVAPLLPLRAAASMMPSFLAGSDLGFHNRFLKFLCFAIPRTQTAIKQSSPHRVEFESTNRI